VRRFVARRVDNAQLAADLTADIFVAALQGAHTFRPELGTEQRWLLGIARNVIADEWDRQRREATSHSRLLGQRVLDTESQHRIEERLDAERSSRRLYKALDTLADLDRALLERVAVDGQTVAETARELGLAPGTARVRLYRARQQIKAQLDRGPRSVSTESMEWTYADG
jgi:RNA polymerase sigma-70 factor (ECF subfamily)